MRLQSINPHDQSLVGELNISTQEEIKSTVNEAKAAFPVWKSLSIQERIAQIKKYRDKVAENKEKIAQLVTLEMGKPISQSRDDVDFELNFLDYYLAKSPKVLADEMVYEKGADHFRITYEPYGVCACIAPWNFPLSMANSGMIPALIAGNTVIIKPSEKASLSQKMLVDLLWETGIPKGVVNVLIGSGKVGEKLINESVDLVWFTGSTKVGQKIYKKCGQKFIKALLEMGGSSPAIVFADADFNNALENLYWGRFLNCGQVCTSTKRVFVEKPIFQKLVEAFVEKLKGVKIGNPTNEDTAIGPLVSQKQLETLKAQVRDALEKGARVEIGGKAPEEKTLAKGNYFEPTILTQIKPEMKIINEEVFGPVLPIIPFESEKEAVVAANRTDYGLSAEIYTSNIERAENLAKQIDAGTVAVNTDNFFRPECPFGGFKKSGLGKEYGEVGLREFSKVKLIAISTPSR